MSQLLFFTLSAMTILSALVVVFTRKPMYSVLSLIVCFFTIAGHYILLNAQFLAITHIIVYAGAIMVLFLFTVMLLNLNADSDVPKSGKLRIAATITAGMLFVTLLASIKSTTLGATCRSTVIYRLPVAIRNILDPVPLSDDRGSRIS
jgi:NADH-quinone oxidoreductase subunit J